MAVDSIELGELEQRIIDRTAELEAANRKLQQKIIEHKQAEEEIRLLLAITRTISEAQDFRSALQETLEKVCEATGWNIGEVWVPSRDGTVLEYGSAVYLNVPRLETFQKLSQQTTYAFGIGVPGRVWASKSPAWIRDVSVLDGPFSVRRDVGLEIGLKAALAIPIVANNRVLAVLAFFMFQSRDEDKRLVEMISAIGSQLGSVIQHKQAQEALRESEARLTLAQEAADIGTGDWDVQSDKVYWSNHQFHLHGVAPTENNMISLEDWLALVHPDDRGRSVNLINATVKSGEGFSTEYRVEWPDGQVHWLCGTARVMRDDNGRAVRMTGVSIDITENKRAEEALRESEARLTLAQEAADIGTWDWDVKSDQTHWSSHQFHLHGIPLTEDKAIGYDAWLALIHPDDRDKAAKDVAMALEDGAGFATEYRIIRPDGGIRWLDAKARVIRDDNGAPIRMIGVNIDITDRKRVERALGRFEGMVSASSDLMAFIDETYTYLAANKPYVEALGKTKKEVIGKRVPDVLGGAAFDSRIKSNLDQCLSGKHINYQLWLNLPPRGGIRFLDVRYDPHRDPNDLVSGVVVGIRDITELKGVENALRESELRYRSIVENAPLCIHEIDTSGRLISMNPAGIRMLGVKDQSEIVGIPYLDVVCSNERGRIEQLLERALAGEPAAFDFNTTTKLGRRIFTSTFNPIRTMDGTVEKLMGMTEDVTERKHAEDEILASHQRLRNLATQLQAVREEERTIIAREVHDELGQALTALKMDLAWVAKNLPNRWKAVPNRVHSMMSLTDSTLGTVRQLSSRLRPAILDDLGLEAAIEWQTQDFTSRGNYACQIDLKAQTLKPNKKRDIAVFRIFQEALTNIARHASARRIAVRLQVKDDELLLVVRDDGKGISDDALTSAYSLGLTGMYERARTLGGSLKIGRDTRNGGTVLTLSVPLTSTKSLAHTE